MDEVQDFHDDLIEEALMFLDNMWALLVAEWKAPRHVDKYFLAIGLFVALYVLASCGKPAF
jgi:hypothetical protein